VDHLLKRAQSSAICEYRRDARDSGKPLSLQEFRRFDPARTQRLKIVASPVRVRVSSSSKSLQIGVFS
jgi:hypothetical protein